MDENQLIHDAKAAIIAGDKPKAQGILTQVIGNNPNNESALLCYALACDDRGTKSNYLWRVLTINPNNPDAKRMLKVMGQLQPEAPPRTPDPDRPRDDYRAPTKGALALWRKQSSSSKLILIVGGLITLAFIVCGGLASNNDGTTATPRLPRATPTVITEQGYRQLADRTLVFKVV